MMFSLSRGAMSFIMALSVAAGISFAAAAGNAMTKDHSTMRSATLSGPLDPNGIDGWAADDHSVALSTFVAHCEASGTKSHPTKAFGISDANLRAICAKTRKIDVNNANDAKAFLEQNFTFRRVEDDGFVTGYYMPELQGSLVGTEDYSIPLHGYPKNLKVLPTRGEVMDGALDGMGLEVLWIKDPIDAFFLQLFRVPPAFACPMASLDALPLPASLATRTPRLAGCSLSGAKSLRKTWVWMRFVPG